MSTAPVAGFSTPQAYQISEEAAQASNRFVQWLKKEGGLSHLDFENKLSELLFKNMQTGLDKIEALTILKELNDFSRFYPYIFSYNYILARVYMDNVLSQEIKLPFSFSEDMFLLLVNSNLMNDDDLSEFKSSCWTRSLPETYWPYLERAQPQPSKPAQSYRPTTSIDHLFHSAPKIQEPVTEKVDHFEIFFNRKLLGFFDACKILLNHLPLTDHEILPCNDRGETIVKKIEIVFIALLQESSKPEFKLKMDKASDSIQLKKEYEERRATIAQLSELLKSKQLKR